MEEVHARQHCCILDNERHARDDDVRACLIHDRALEVAEVQKTVQRKMRHDREQERRARRDREKKTGSHGNLKASRVDTEYKGADRQVTSEEMVGFQADAFAGACIGTARELITFVITRLPSCSARYGRRSIPCPSMNFVNLALFDCGQ